VISGNDATLNGTPPITNNLTFHIDPVRNYNSGNRLFDLSINNYYATLHGTAAVRGG